MTVLRQLRFTRRTGLGLLAAAAISPFLTLSPSAAQEATPVFAPVIPAGPLGEQITWLVGVLGGTEEVTEEIVTEHFAESFLVLSPASDLVTHFQEQAATLAPVHIVPGTLVFGQQDGVAIAGFEVAGAGDQLLLVNISVNDTSGQIETLIFYPGAARLATPAAEIAFPPGPLGDHARWFLDVLNAGPGAITAAQLAEHLTPEFLAGNPPDQVLMQIADLVDANEVWQLDPASVVSTKDLPATVTRFVVNGYGGANLQVSMTLDRDSGLLSGLEFELVGSLEATPVG